MNKIDFIPFWWDWPEIQEIRRIFRGRKACFIGGALRDGMANILPHNFNIFTALSADAVMELMKNSDIQTKPRDNGSAKTPIKFITAEENSLVPGIETNDIADSAHLYASHFDFSINTMFMDMEGSCYDNFGAAEDISNGRVCFLGNPIRSVLDSPERMLRFFRLYAWFGKESPDETSLAACIANSELLAHISPEKIGAEMLRLFSGPAFATAFSQMDHRDILSEILGLPFTDHGWLAAMERMEAGRSGNNARRLALLLLSIDLPPETALSYLSEIWRITPAAQQEIHTLLKFYPYVDMRTDISKLGITPQQFDDILLIQKSIGDTAPAESYPG